MTLEQIESQIEEVYHILVNLDIKHPYYNVHRIRFNELQEKYHAINGEYYAVLNGNRRKEHEPRD